ncbi:hypothetical protein A4A49_28971 [Nicotiana attenuata]|uniref:Uncharacterized protein n=1 Tax=Nicotiana attenuata TaxID=49451 RepID=A0A1J6KAH1_NICAT|nr:hypothetical protein A4A49_28971 [Nicotiana attenuata]
MSLLKSCITNQMVQKENQLDDRDVETAGHFQQELAKPAGTISTRVPNPKAVVLKEQDVTQGGVHDRIATAELLEKSVASDMVASGDRAASEPTDKSIVVVLGLDKAGEEPFAAGSNLEATVTLNASRIDNIGAVSYANFTNWAGEETWA